MSNMIHPIKSGSESLPFVLDGICTEYITKDVECSGGAQLCSLYIAAGECGTVELPDGEHELHAGSVCFIPAKVPFRFRAAKNPAPARFAAFLCSGGAGERIGYGSFFFAEVSKDSAITELFGKLAETAADPLASPDTMSVQLYGLLLAVRRAAFMKDEEKYGSGDILREALKFMDRHYGENITLERLAVISGVSLQHFCRVFKARMGMRPMEYLARRRTAEAKELLAVTDMKIGDIAQSVGFDDPNYFGITFRKYEGDTPTEYRHKFGK